MHKTLLSLVTVLNITPLSSQTAWQVNQLTPSRPLLLPNSVKLNSGKNSFLIQGLVPVLFIVIPVLSSAW